MKFKTFNYTVTLIRVNQKCIVNGKDCYLEIYINLVMFNLS